MKTHWNVSFPHLSFTQTGQRRYDVSQWEVWFLSTPCFLKKSMLERSHVFPNWNQNVAQGKLVTTLCYHTLYLNKLCLLSGLYCFPPVEQNKSTTQAKFFNFSSVNCHSTHRFCWTILFLAEENQPSGKLSNILSPPNTGSLKMLFRTIGKFHHIGSW